MGSESEWKAIHLFAWSTFSESANSSTFHFFPNISNLSRASRKRVQKLWLFCESKSFFPVFRFQNQIFNMVLGLAPEPSKWVSVYFPVSWLTQVHTTIKVLDTIAVRFWSSSWPVWPWFSDNSGWANPALPRPEDRGRYRNHQPCLDFWILWIYGDTNYIIMLHNIMTAYGLQALPSVIIMTIKYDDRLFFFFKSNPRLGALPPVGSSHRDSEVMRQSWYSSLWQSL